MSDGHQRFLCRTARLEKTSEIAAAAELWDRKIGRTDARFPGPFPIPVSAIATIYVTLAVFGSAAVINFDVHNALNDGQGARQRRRRWRQGHDQREA